MLCTYGPWLLSLKSLSPSPLSQVCSLSLSLSHPLSLSLSPLSLSKTSLSLSPVCVAVNRPLLSASHCCFSLQLARTAYAKRRRDWSLAAARTWPWDGHGLMSHGPHGSGSIAVLVRGARAAAAASVGQTAKGSERAWRAGPIDRVWGHVSMAQRLPSLMRSSGSTLAAYTHG
jgi:hypothetical protein